ncbi:MAG: universal stress protein [Deltaproteobacteria bacterium]|nr:universal stress protein [Deltaproteobacteria bacterium]
MFTVRRILVPIDDTPLANRALDAGLTLAERFDAHLFPLHVRQSADEERPDVDDDLIATELLAVEGTVRARLREGHSLAFDHIHPLVMTGEPADIIVLAAEQNGCDVIVMGTHGRHGLYDWLYGSTTEQVLKRTKAAMVVLRDLE